MSMRFEVIINDTDEFVRSLRHRMADDLAEMIRHPEVLHAQPGSGAYVIHRIVPPPSDAEFDELLEGER